MNNDGDYLWDKTGEPDPEIQQLEEILGTLRYQPRRSQSFAPSGWMRCLWPTRSASSRHFQ